jgi:phage terminase large subunit
LAHIFAQEVERNRSASVEGTIIPGEWVHAAIDAHERLHFEDDGLWGAGLDVADGGGDLNALAVRTMAFGKI